MSTKGLSAVAPLPTPVTTRATLPTSATSLDSYPTSAAQTYLANHHNLGLLTAAYFKAIRCTLPNCRCECFSPGKTSLRTCETCKHGWVAHALDKLGYRSMYQMGMHVEIVQPNIVFDIASLMLYGAQATPVRLKILLDRLFSVLQHDEVLQVLHGFNWTYEDYARGYILQDSNGRVLDKWLIATHDEEQIILQQFLRFGETKSIAQEIILQDTRENRERHLVNSPKNDSEIKKFIERSNLSMQNYLNKYQQARQQLMGATNLSNFVTSSGSTPARIISPTAIAAFSPTSSAGSGRSVSSEPMNMSMQNSSPVTSSPLSRLQTMQPFDYRREHLSPTVSPVASGKSTPPSSGSKSPENLSISTRATTPPLSTTPNSMQTMLTPKQELDDSKYSAIMSSDDSSDGAINYSMKETSNTSPSSVFAERKIKHLRKSSNPVKRQWQPNPSFGSTLISPSGKKRVLCTACNKTFCDKGALKIHYSAVHLKEMHKCTVEGCNMMFSSRRSRNRHSANPNPKLHMPNAKRKYPDGSLMDEGKYDNKKAPSSLPSSLPGMPPGMTVPCLPAFPMPAIAPEVRIPKSEPGLVTEIAPVLTPENYFMNPNGHMTSSFLPSPSKVPKMEDQDQGLDGRKDQSTRSASKRKSLMPTRCAVTEEVFVMSDDNENSNDAIERDYDCLPQDLSLKESGHKSETDADDAKTIEDDCDDAEGRDMEEDQVAAESQEKNGKVEIDENGRMSAENGEMNGVVENNDTQDSMNGDMSVDNLDEGSCDEQSGHSSDNDSDVEMHSLRSNGHGLQDIDIPLDKDNPRKCSMCGKLFPNHFGLRTHFQNVHLKLMHTCHVDGCNAAFPSKRSRDRHSSNLNLHRKLLSTAPNNGDKSPNKTTGQNLRDEFLPRIYSSFNNNNGKYEDLEEGELAPISLVTNNVMMASAGGPQSPDGNSDGGEVSDIEQDDDSPKPDPDGTVKCHICKQRFRDNLVLKEHYEKVHPKEMYHCTIHGCDKIFSTRKSRNRHSQNENLHRHLSPTKINGTA